jgi:hypothetical protein
MDDHADKIGQAFINVVRKDIVIFEQVVGIGGVGGLGCMERWPWWV